MTRELIAAIAVGLVAVQPALSQTTDDRATTCVARAPGESDAAWGGRTHEYCEIRWSDLAAHAATGRWTHPDFIDHCVRRCRIGKLDAHAPGGSVAPAPVLFTAAGVGLAIGAAVSMSGSHTEEPASP